MDPHDEPLWLHGMADAVTLAFVLRRRFRRGYGVAVLDHCDLVLQLTFFAGRRHSIETAVAWAACFATDDPRAERVILYSTMPGGVADEVREADLETLRRARAELADAGVLLVDWLQCDQKHIRSLDYACDGEGWQRAASLA